MRGPKPVPTRLKLLRGNPSKRPLNVDEPQPGALETACPPELVDATARVEWDRAIVPAIEIGQVTAADRTLAIAHCALWATWLSQLADAMKHPHVVSAGKHRYPIPNPARGMANKTLLLLSQVDEKLGFSPTSRSRVQLARPGAPGGATALDKRRARFFSITRG
jgi:P27 family predicted phage terminase small subunit